jgi:hypothetical protein
VQSKATAGASRPFNQPQECPELSNFSWRAGSLRVATSCEGSPSLNGLEDAEGSGDLHLIAAPARHGCCPGMACAHYRYWLFGEAFVKEESAQERVPRGVGGASWAIFDRVARRANLTIVT